MARKAAIREEDGYAMIRIPIEEVHALRVALSPCPCRSAKSISTGTIRQRLYRALGRIGNGVRR